MFEKPARRKGPRRFATTHPITSRVVSFALHCRAKTFTYADLVAAVYGRDWLAVSQRQRLSLKSALAKRICSARAELTRTFGADDGWLFYCRRRRQWFITRKKASKTKRERRNGVEAPE